jgi:hypothetical protein
MAKRPIAKAKFIQLIPSEDKWIGLDTNGDIYRADGFVRGPKITWERIPQEFSEDA